MPVLVPTTLVQVDVVDVTVPVTVPVTVVVTVEVVTLAPAKLKQSLVAWAWKVAPRRVPPTALRQLSA